MRVTMIGHSTLLIEAADARIVTDPFFATGMTGPLRRTLPPSMTAEEAAALATLVLVSHAHPDHCDPEFFAALDARVPVIVPKGMEWPAGMAAPGGAIELEEWHDRTFGDVRVTATAAEHGCTAAGYVIKAERRRFYFAGDTNSAPFMKRIGMETPIESAALPIRHARLGPGITASTIVETVEMLDAERVIAMHLHVRMKGGSLANLKDPASKVGKTLTDWKPGVKFSAPRPGDSIEL